MVSRVYNRIAHTYDTDWSGIYHRSREINIRQILNSLAEPKLDQVLDLAVGTGNALHDLSKQIDIKQCNGNDISQGMLDQARSKLGNNLNCILDNVLNINNNVAPESQDLVLCHFLMGFVQPQAVLSRAYETLKPGGLISLASTTGQALSEIHGEYFPNASRFLKIDSAIEETTTPQDHDRFIHIIESHGFEIVDAHNDRQTLCFRSIHDVNNWALNSGWAAQYFDRNYWLKRLGTLAWLRAAELLYAPLYPVSGTNDISLILARRPYR